MAAQGPLQATSSRTCQLCEEREASHYCNCVNPPTLFCTYCLPRHHAKYPRTIHQIIPIAALSQSSEKHKRKSEDLQKGVSKLRRNVEQAEQFYHEFDDLMKRCIDFLTEYRSSWLQRMRIEKEALSVVIETAVQETRNSMDLGIEPVSPLGQVLWTMSFEDLQISRYSMAFPDLQTLYQTLTSYKNQLQGLCERFSISLPEAGEGAKRICAGRRWSPYETGQIVLKALASK